MEKANEIKPLEDTDPIMFGAHRGKPMQEIPAEYLHFLWTTGLQHDLKAPIPGRLEQYRVADYVRRNLDALRMEYKDGIWR